MWSNPQSLLPEAQLELMVKQAPNGTGFGWTGRAGVARQMRIPPREPRNNDTKPESERICFTSNTPYILTDFEIERTNEENCTVKNVLNPQETCNGYMCSNAVFLLVYLRDKNVLSDFADAQNGVFSLQRWRTCTLC
jgi:hypothetical protein